MILVLDGEIEAGSLEKLVSAYNNLEKDDILKIFFSTEGGRMDIAEAIIEIINQNAGRTELSGYSVLASAGFYIFFKSICPRQVLPGTMGMLHLTTWGAEIKEGLLKTSRAEYIKNNMKKSLDRNIKFLNSIGISERDLELFKNGEDIYYNSETLIKFLKKQVANDSI